LTGTGFVELRYNDGDFEKGKGTKEQIKIKRKDDIS
jgi:hypothetical protein